MLYVNLNAMATQSSTSNSFGDHLTYQAATVTNKRWCLNLTQRSSLYWDRAIPPEKSVGFHSAHLGYNRALRGSG